jgi:hypothetical protein
VGLRDIELKEQYRSDRDDMVSEFFIPCLDNCIEYDRAIELVSVRSLTNFYLGIQNFIDNQPRMRIVTGHRLKTADLNFLSKIFQNGKSFVPTSGLDDEKAKRLYDMIKSENLKIKIAIPNSEEVYGSFGEKIGIFRDEKDDIVAFTGTSNETFDPQTRNFESIDVFTSWNDKSRVEIKIRDFEDLWENKTKNVDIFDFEYAVKNNMLKYSAEWIQTKA